MKLEFSYAANRPNPSRRVASTPFRVLILGDLSAREGRESPQSLEARRPRPLDVDNFDQRLQEFAPQVEYCAPNESPMNLRFTDLEEFHPDALFRRGAWFEALRSTRERLRDPSTAAAEAAALRSSRLELSSASSVREASPTGGESNEPDDELLERLLGGPRSQASPRPATPPALYRFIRGIVAPHITPSAEPDLDSLVASVDAAIAERMRRTLHDPAFQRAESIWRGLRETVARVETGEDLQLFVVDVSRAELEHDLEAAGDDLARTALHRWAVSILDSPDAEPWSLIVGHYTFGRSDHASDALSLAKLGAIASRAGAPFIAAIDPHWFGCPPLTKTLDPRNLQPVSADYQALREAPMAPWIGLAFPRVLARLPYGKSADPVDAFEFEELDDDSPHEHYLWGNPGLACATLLAQSFRERGAVDPSQALDLLDLPAYTRTVDGETRLQPCAEGLIPESAVEVLLARGVTPLVSFARENRVRLVRCPSIAHPPQPLPIRGA